MGCSPALEEQDWRLVSCSGWVSDVMFSQLIDYGKLGDTNERAMRMADFWLTVSAPCLPPKPHPLLPEWEGLLEKGGLGRIKLRHSLMDKRWGLN